MHCLTSQGAKSSQGHSEAGAFEGCDQSVVRAQGETAKLTGGGTLQHLSGSEVQSVFKPQNQSPEKEFDNTLQTSLWTETQCHELVSV
uniref:Uncharacterized protein n=1 Tax=Knipowitschia caucasica TaxID=637954 RepID=A0AAV2MP00_KNICA